VVTGLAWTPTGGDILFIEATRMPGKGNLILTGSLGDVMKESARAALSYLRSHAADWKLDPKFADETDLHIHVPAGAIPKDGPFRWRGHAGRAVFARQRQGGAARDRHDRRDHPARPHHAGGRHQGEGPRRRPRRHHLHHPARKNRRHLTDVPPEIRKKLTFSFVDRAEDALRLLTKSL
jgi:ATP-dependent Lon protease